jgi:hypothetical protein
MVGSLVSSMCFSASTTPYGPPTLLPVDGTDAPTFAAHADLRLLHLDLGDQPAPRGFQPGEVDAGDLADEAAPAVAADQVLRSEQGVIGQLHVDGLVVLREAHHLVPPNDRDPELFDPARQDRLELALPQREYVVVAAGEVADVHRDPGEAERLNRVPRCQEPVRDATLIEHLDGAGVEPTGARSVDDLAGAPLDDDDVDPRQRQLGGQHEPGRATSGDRDLYLI